MALSTTSGELARVTAELERDGRKKLVKMLRAGAQPRQLLEESSVEPRTIEVVIARLRGISDTTTIARDADRRAKAEATANRRVEDALGAIESAKEALRIAQAADRDARNAQAYAISLADEGRAAEKLLVELDAALERWVETGSWDAEVVSASPLQHRQAVMRQLRREPPTIAAPSTIRLAASATFCSPEEKARQEACKIAGPAVEFEPSAGPPVGGTAA